MDHHFNFTYGRVDEIAPGQTIELIADLDCIAIVEDDDIDDGDWFAACFLVRDAYASDGADFRRVAAGTPLHAALTKHCRHVIVEDISERWVLRQASSRDCGYGHTMRELL